MRRLLRLEAQYSVPANIVGFDLISKLLNFVNRRMLIHTTTSNTEVCSTTSNTKLQAKTNSFKQLYISQNDEAMINQKPNLNQKEIQMSKNLIRLIFHRMKQLM